MLRMALEGTSGTRDEAVAEETDEVKSDARGRVGASEEHESDFREFPNYSTHQDEENDKKRGLLFGPRNVLEAVVADGAGHERTEGRGQNEPGDGPAPTVKRYLVAVDQRRDYPCGCRSWHAHKKFRTAGDHPLHVESGEAPCAADQECQAENPTKLTELLDVYGVRWRDAAEAPGVGENSRSDAEADDIGERIELNTELSVCAREASDTTVKRIE